MRDRSKLAVVRVASLVASGVLGACTFPAVFAPGAADVRDVATDSAQTDATVDAAMDVTVDAAVDVTVDVAMDATMDVMADAAADVATDAAADVAVDVAREATADGGSACGVAIDGGIGPRIQWGRNWGGPGDQSSPGGTAGSFGQSGDIATDASGNVYVLSTYSTSIEIGVMPYTTTRLGTLLIKFSPTGTREWVRHFHSTGGSGDFTAEDFFWDAGDNEIVVIAKGFGGDPRVDGALVGTAPLNESPAIVRINAVTGVVNGTFGFSTAVNWGARAFVRTPRGTVLIVGTITAPTTLPGGTVATPTPSGSRDALVVEWNYRSNTLVNHWVIGGGADEDASAVAELPGGDIVIGGKMNSPTATTVGMVTVPASNGFDAFFARFNRAGTVSAYRLLRGPGESLVHRIVVGPSGDFYLSGLYETSVEYDPAMSLSLGGSGSGGFVGRVDPATNNYRWFVGQTGANGFFGLRRIVVDGCERVHGAFTSNVLTAFDRFAGAVLNPSGVIPVAQSFVVVLRGDGTVERLERLGSPLGFFATSSVALLPDGRHAIKGDLARTLTIEGATFTTSDDRIDQFAAALSF